MATSKAQNAPANGRGNAGDKTNGANGAIKVVMPDANGDFVAPIPKGAIEKVQVVDVDMVLQLKDGTSLVLAGGAISAMDASHTEVKFSDGLQGLSNLFDLVGTIAIPKLDPILSSLQGQPNAEGQGAGANQPVAADSSGLTASVTTQIVNQLTQIVQVNSQSVTIQTVDPTAQVAVLSQNTKTGDANQQPLQHVEPPIPPERPGVIPQEHIIGPDAPAMALTLVNLTTITQIGNVLYGSGGIPASAIDGSNNTQFAPQVINAPANATEIHAISNIPPNDFIKVVNITLTGNGIAQSIEIKGVPPGMSIANGTDLGGGVWSVPVVAGQRDYAIQIEYTTVPADPLAPIHQQFSMEFDVTMTTADGIVNLSQVKQFVVKDVNSANDLTYIDSTTGEGVYVLPAQGNSHIIHAGDAGVTIYGSNAADFLFGGAGADTIHGGSGNTYFEGGGGADQLIGGAGGVNTAGYTLSTTGVTVDLAHGTGTGGDAQGDTLTNIQNVIGSTHNDVIVSSAAANNINGGGGVDTVSYAGSGTGVTVDLAAGTGLGGDAAGDKLTGIQNVIGSDHNDTFFASTAANAFDGRVHDTIGGDTVSYANDTSGAGVIVDLSDGTRTGGAAAGDTYQNIQNIIGTAAADTFIDGAGANSYDGTNRGAPGLDTVSYVDSNTGVKVDFHSGRGEFGYAEGDSYINIQNVIGSAYDDIFNAGSDSRSFDGGGGFNTVTYSNAAGSVIIDAANHVGHGAAEGNTYTNIQKFQGGGSDDTFIAGTDANWFDGGGVGAGSDTVDYSQSSAVVIDLFNTDGSGTSGGLAAGDRFTNIANVIGGAGDDTFFANSLQNSFEGGGGNNTVNYEHTTSTSGSGVTVDLSATNGSGTSGNFALGDKFSNIQNVVGSHFDDTFVASSVANIFTGNGGSDTVSYATSASTDATGVTVNLLTGQGTGDFAEGDQYIAIQNATGSAYNDTFVANALANTFTGGGGSDTVSYAGSTAVTVDLVNGVGAGGNAEGDKYINVQNVIGGDADDTIIDNLAANTIDGGTVSLHNRVSYANSVSAPGVAAGVTVDLNKLDGSGNSGGYAQGDKLVNIQDLTGSAADDTFGASAAANNLDGGASTAASHNRVSYDSSVDGGGAAAGVTVDLVNGVGAGGFAQGDTYANIQDVTGSKADDLIIDSAAANTIDGGTGSLHNTVSYANSVTSGGAAAGVTVDLNFTDGTGTSGGYAQGDKLSNIQNLVGGQADDTFVANAAANVFDGGTGSLHNRVSYLASNDDTLAHTPVGVTVNLSANTGAGGYAQGDTYANIQDVTGSNAGDTIVASLAANNLDGAGGVDTVSYDAANNNIGVSVDLFHGQGAGAGSFAENDTYAHIENATGSHYNDTFFASADANRFTGNGGVDTVDYSYAADGNGVIVDLNAGQGSNGIAAGDIYAGIQNATGTIYDDRFVGSAAANKFTGGGGVDTVDYSTLGGGAVNVDFSAAGGGAGTGGLAQGDTYVGIRNAIGGEFDDTFTANTAVNAATSNSFDGGASTAASHNKVSYAGTLTGVTVNLATGLGSGGAVGDHYANIQDVLGTAADDTIVASAAANTIDGGGTSLHNRVDYSASVDAGGVAAGVTVDLSQANGLGTSGGYAQGDKLSNIQDITGSAADDLFIASTVANNFDGGASTAASHNKVSYQNSLSGVVVDLSATNGSGTSGGAAGDTFVNIQDVIGSNLNDTFVASTANNNFNGGTGSDTVSYANVVGATGVTVDLTAGGALTAGAAAGDTYTSIENVIGSNNNDLFIDGGAAAANAYAGGAGIDRISYDGSTAGVTVNFGSGLNTGTGAGGYAALDTYTGIENVTGSKFDDTFIASTTVSAATANAFDGNTGTLHNRVSYAGTGTAVTVNLSGNTVGGVAAGAGGGGAAGDTYVNIQDVTGTLLDDTIVASAAANFIDGGGTSLHNCIDYSQSVDGGGVAAGVIVDLTKTDGTGTSGGYAAGDTLVNIQDVTGSGAADTIVASSAANALNGGLGNDTVDYSGSAAVTVNLSGSAVNGLAAGTGAGGLAAGDTYTSIENVKGGAGDDTFIASTAANVFDGGAGSDTVDYSAATTAVTVNLSNGAAATGNALAAGDTYTNMENIVGGSGNDTLTGATGGNSTFTGGAGADVLTGLGTNNTASYRGSAAVTIDLNLAGAGVGGDAQGDVFNNIQNVIGSSNNDLFFASIDANRLDGGAGGTDTVSYAKQDLNGAITSGVNVDLSTGVAAGTGNYAQGDTYVNIRNLIGTQYADTLKGVTGGGSTLTGGAGADTLIGQGFNSGNLATANTANYATSANGVKVDLVNGTGDDAINGVVSDAHGDMLAGIQNIIGTNASDIFIIGASTIGGVNNPNTVDGGSGGIDTVSYANETNAVTVDLSTATGHGFTTGNAVQDTLIHIQNATGGAGNDLFLAGNAANVFDGGNGSDTVSYASSITGAVVDAAHPTLATTGVIVDLFHNTGSGNWAANDSYSHIENVIGSAGNDLFISDHSATANKYDGGAGGSDTVSYEYSSTDVQANLLTPGTNTGDAAGDTYTHISNLMGSGIDGVTSTLTGDGAANTLTAMGANTINFLDGGGASSGSDILDGRLGGTNTLTAGNIGDTIFDVNTDGFGNLAANIIAGGVHGSAAGGATATMKIFGMVAGIDLNMHSFKGHADNLTIVDLKDGINTDITIDYNDVLALGKGSGGINGRELTLNLDDHDSVNITDVAGEHWKFFGNGDYVFYADTDPGNTVALATLHTRPTP